MLSFLFGLVLGVLLTFALLGMGLWLVVRGNNRNSVAHVLHAAALALKGKPASVSNEVKP